MRWSTTMLTLEWTWTWVECLLFFILIETGKCGPSGDPSECIQYNSNPLGWDGLGIGRILFFFFIDGLIFFSFIVLIELQTWSKIKYCFQRRRHPNRGRNIVQTCGAFLQIFIFFHRFLFPFFLFFFFLFFGGFSLFSSWWHRRCWRWRRCGWTWIDPQSTTDYPATRQQPHHQVSNNAKLNPPPS